MRVRLTELHRTLREQGQPATVVYVTHDQTEAMTMGERICVLKEGVIQQVDTPVALYQKPANAFVAGFIGSPEMNLVAGELQAHEGSAAVRLGGQLLPLSSARNHSLQGRQGAVTFGLRPEHIGAQPRPQGDSLAVPATLRFLEHMGSEIYVHADIGDQAVSARVPVDQADELQTRERGAPITLHLQMAAAHLFDAGNGVAVT